MSSNSPPPPFVLVADGASRLADPLRRDALVAAVISAVEARTGAAPEVRVTSTAAAGRAAAQEAVAAGAPLLVVVGGDGSVRSAAAVVAGTGIALGIVPGGTGNLMAATLGVPRSPCRAAAVLATARERWIDVGRAWVGAPAIPTPFIVAAGVGFDARVMATTTERRKRTFGFGAYFAAAAVLATRIRPFPVRLMVDGVIHETDALVVFVANAGQLIPGLLGPRLPLVPDDGLLDVLLARGGGTVGGSRAALELLFGRAVHTEVGRFGSRFSARRVEVSAPGDEPIEVDGDVIGAGHLVAEVVPGALRVLVPA